MAMFSPRLLAPALCAFYAVALNGARAQLSPKYYSGSCPNVYDTVRQVVQAESYSNPRILASLTRLHFHDCFVNGCDGSLLLDDSPTIKSEKDALPNKSVLGFEVVDLIKTRLETDCPGVVSCADILALAAEISVELAGGPRWSVMLGRRDGTTTNYYGALNLPNPQEALDDLRKKFSVVGLNDRDFIALQGAHTIGRAQCRDISGRLYFTGSQQPDPRLDQTYLAELQQNCPANDDKALTNLDPTTPDTFDNYYYANILKNRGLLQSDQALFTPGASTAFIVQKFADSQDEFFQSFATAMTKMGNIGTLTGSLGEIRTTCRKTNGQ